MKSASKLWTVGSMAETLNQNTQRVYYVLKTRPWIRPRTQVGYSNVYDAVSVERVSKVLSRLDQMKAGAL